mgnify:CR=1 FL=1|jgi:cytochrome c biogenesis protein CcmG, thiol:disulfide interchange protein DsbE
MMNRRFYIGLGVAFVVSLLILLIYGLFFASHPREIPTPQIGKKAYPFATRTFDGEPISLEKFRGKPIVLNFWASWCIACKTEARILEAAHQHFTPKGAVFIGIAINDTREASLKFIRRYGKTYLLAPDVKTGDISLDYGVTAVPETFMIDKNGFIQNKIMGAVTMNILAEFLNQQLP